MNKAQVQYFLLASVKGTLSWHNWTKTVEGSEVKGQVTTHKKCKVLFGYLHIIRESHPKWDETSELVAPDDDLTYLLIRLGFYN